MQRSLKDNDGRNYRNGHNKKTLKSKYGNIDVAIPRDRQASFEPQLVKKREVILDGSEDLILSLYTKGMSVRDIQNHLDDLYGYELSTTTISNITEKIMVKVDEWQHRPLEAIYPIIFMDAIVLKIKIDSVVKNIAVYIMLGVHQICSSLRFVSWKDRKAVAKDLKAVYTALNEEQALLSLDEFKHI